MAFALVIGLVLTFSGVALYHVTTTDITQVANDRDDAQAFYYAKSGVELAVGLLAENPDRLATVGQTEHFYGSLSNGATFGDEETDDYNIGVEIERTGDGYIVRSTGIVRTGDGDGAQSAANALGFTISRNVLLAGGGAGPGGGGGGGGTGAPLALFSLGGITLEGSAAINGNVGTNSNQANRVSFEWSPMISGDLYVGYDTPDPVTAVVDPPSKWWNMSEHITGTIARLPSFRNYPLPIFPAFPTNLTARDLLTTTKEDKIIPADGSYTKISIVSNRRVYVDLAGGTRILRVGDLDIQQGQLVLQNAGAAGKLIIYVDNKLTLAGSSTINQGGNPAQCVIYYKGTNAVNFSGSTNSDASLFIQNANLTIGGSGGVTGDIISGGPTVNISGAAEAHVRVLYAPNAALNVTGSGNLSGTAVAKTALLSGSGRITASESLNTAFYDSLEWGAGGKPNLFSQDAVVIPEPALAPEWRILGQWRSL